MNIMLSVHVIILGKATRQGHTALTGLGMKTEDISEGSARPHHTEVLLPLGVTAVDSAMPIKEPLRRCRTLELVSLPLLSAP
jgi:hypothetical protein